MLFVKTSEGKNFNSVMPYLRWIILTFLIVRLIITIFGAVIVWDQQPISAWVGHQIFETRSITVPDWGKIGDLLINVWYRWDTGWYLKIAAMGYDADDGSIIFPPLYPLLIAFIAPAVGGNFLLAALIISNISCLIALILFFYVAKEELGSIFSAQKSILYLLAFPSAFYLFSGYSESLFIMLALTAWINARRKNWLVAGVFAGLGAITRLQGWVLVFPFTWMMLSNPHKNQMNLQLNEVSLIIRNLKKRSYWQYIWYTIKSGGWAVFLLPILALVGYMSWLEIKGYGEITTAYN